MKGVTIGLFKTELLATPQSHGVVTGDGTQVNPRNVSSSRKVLPHASLSMERWVTPTGDSNATSLPPLP